MWRNISVLVASGLVVAGCARETPVPAPTPVPPPISRPAVPATPAPAPAPAPTLALSTATSIDSYKREFAQRVLDGNSARTFSGRLPPELYGVVVLKIVLDRAGNPTAVQPMRVPSHAPELGPVAISSVRQAAPYVRPSSNLLRGASSLEFVETWLFGQDGRFQIRSLAGPQ